MEPAVGYTCVAACLGVPQEILWAQLSGICVLLHAWAGLRGFSGASCRVYGVAACLGRLGGPQAILWGQLSGIRVLLHAWAGLLASGDSLGPAVGYRA